MKSVETIDEYIGEFSKETQRLLVQLRKLIQKAAPEATECINYAMPTFQQAGNLVHFAAYKGHIGLYPAPSAIKAFQEELSVYKNSKGAVQFPLDQPLPVDLIARIVKFRVAENVQKSALKKATRVCKNGHKFIKTSDCPTCPICERAKPKEGFFEGLSAPAIRALEQEGIKTLKQLSGYTESQILKLHGIGKTAIPKLQAALQAAGLTFKK